MNNQKNEVVFDPKEYSQWINNSALTPTPIILNDDLIRVYCGFRDEAGISRIGYVDVSIDDPWKIVKVSAKPVLDIGRPGCFDDNGVILGHVEKIENEIRMYYVGFQIVQRVKFLAFSGLAISVDNGEDFHRTSEVPVLDRTDGGSTIMAIHSIIKSGDEWKVWYAKGNDWECINNRFFPRYNIWECSSSDGFEFYDSKLVVDCDRSALEYRIGRPSVFELFSKRFMFYTKGSISGLDYFPGLAIQLSDGSWQRIDSSFPLKLSSSGWDSIHLSYPRLICAKGRYYIFYNGNNMGHEGFGVKEVTEWVNSELKDIALRIS